MASVLEGGDQRLGGGDTDPAERVENTDPDISGTSSSGGAPIALGPIPVVLRQSWPVSDGEIVLEVRLRRPLPAGAFSQIGRLVTEAEALATELKGGDGTASPDAAS